MQRFIALLRAINVGGHTVKMDRLRALFEALGFANVATFIASGNVVFDCTDRDAAALEARIERHLQQWLGYEVATFLRSPAELAAIARGQPFPAAALQTPGTALYIAFLRAPPPAEAQQRLMSFRSGIDDFHVHRREVYWLARKGMSQSAFSGALLERTLGMPATLRNLTTVHKLVARHPAGARRA